MPIASRDTQLHGEVVHRHVLKTCRHQEPSHHRRPDHCCDAGEEIALVQIPIVEQKGLPNGAVLLRIAGEPGRKGCEMLGVKHGICVARSARPILDLAQNALALQHLHSGTHCPILVGAFACHLALPLRVLRADDCQEVRVIHLAQLPLPVSEIGRLLLHPNDEHNALRHRLRFQSIDSLADDLHGLLVGDDHDNVSHNLCLKWQLQCPTYP
mmetsp:Transcript_50316/g.97161  ORF Transcript_50316/g.97161 Transcript_50316/m.97161 type:complete len:212 (+) Transcript_50316:567-1202(+)